MTCKFTIRFSEDEKQLLEKEARYNGFVKLCDYIKYRLFLENGRNEGNA